MFNIIAYVYLLFHPLFRLLYLQYINKNFIWYNWNKLLKHYLLKSVLYNWFLHRCYDAFLYIFLFKFIRSYFWYLFLIKYVYQTYEIEYLSKFDKRYLISFKYFENVKINLFLQYVSNAQRGMLLTLNI